jgi:hypothetical protein
MWPVCGPLPRPAALIGLVPFDYRRIYRWTRPAEGAAA